MYFAPTLKLNYPIWSNDKKLRKQDKVKIYSTDELVNSLLPSKVDDERELSEWAKEEFDKARKEPEENYTELEDLRKEIEDDLY